MCRAYNKAEYPPMHSVEHILNQTMIRMFGCGRSRSPYWAQEEQMRLHSALRANSRTDCRNREPRKRSNKAELAHQHWIRNKRECSGRGWPEQVADRCQRDSAHCTHWRLRHLCVHRYTCGQHKRDWHIQDYKPLMGERNFTFAFQIDLKQHNLSHEIIPLWWREILIKNKSANHWFSIRKWVKTNLFPFLFVKVNKIKTCFPR